MDLKGAWTDGRMDEFAERTEGNFKEVRREIGDTRVELRDTRTELRDELQTEIRALRTEMNDRFAGIEQRFNILFGALATGFIGAVVSHFLG
jgi:phage host-nuclease inhibitor protein Gam